MSTTFGWTLAPAALATRQPARRIVLHAGLSWTHAPTRVEARVARHTQSAVKS
jgi:hypothetical protein